MRKVIPWFSIILLTVTIALAGCGAGGSSSTNPVVVKKTVSGVAAAGAPMIGRAYLKDSSNPPKTLGPTEIAVDGSFSFDVMNLTAPFYLQAEGAVGGQSYKLHSVAMSNGTANINPLTDLAVAAAAGVNDPAAVFNDPLANSISPTNLNKAIADIQAMLQPLLTAYSANPDFLSGSYTADNTGLDGLLDVVAVSINTATGDVSINDKIQNTQIGAATTTTINQPADPISPSEATQSVSVPTDIQEIASLLSKFATTYNKGSNLQATNLDPYFAADFGIDDGLNRTQAIQDWIESASGCDNCISSISGISIKEKKANGDYIITLIAYASNGSIYSGTEFTVTKEGDSWKFKGNGYKSDIDLYPILEKYVYSDGKASVGSGIRVDVSDKGNLGLQSATITGPGLPEQGIEMAKGVPDTVDMESVNWGQGEFYHIYPMSDAVIEALPETDLTYTLVIKDAQGAPVETRTVKLPKRPHKVSEVDSSYFLQVSGIPNQNTSSLKLGGGPLSFTYTKPTAYQVAEMNMEVGYSGSSGWDGTEKELSLNETSASIVTLGLPEGAIVYGGWLRVDVFDLYGRHVTVQWEFSPTSTTLFGNPDTSAKSSIVGNWYGGDPKTRDFGVLTFFDNGTYVMAEDGIADSSGQAGMEHGTYTWDAATGAFTASASLADTSGEWGLSHPAGAVTIKISGNTLSYTDGSEVFTATRLMPDASNLIVGTLYGEGNPGERPTIYVITFFADGTYMMADDDDSATNTDPNNPVCQPGIERGIYTWNPVTGSFSANPTIVDTNGECGFSTGDGLGTTGTITISGNTWTMDLGDHGGTRQGTRLVP